MVFPIHVSRGAAHVPFLRPASEWTFCPTCPLAQLRGPLLCTGVSICRHVTAQRQSHWFNCSSTRPTYGYSFQDILQLSVNQCQSVNTATFTWHPPVFAARVETDRCAGESGKPCPHVRTECFNLLKDACAIVLTIYMDITPHTC